MLVYPPPPPKKQHLNVSHKASLPVVLFPWCGCSKVPPNEVRIINVLSDGSQNYTLRGMLQLEIFRMHHLAVAFVVGSFLDFFHFFGCLMALGVGMIGHFPTFWCDEHFRKTFQTNLSCSHLQHTANYWALRASTNLVCFWFRQTKKSKIASKLLHVDLFSPDLCLIHLDVENRQSCCFWFGDEISLNLLGLHWILLGN